MRLDDFFVGDHSALLHDAGKPQVTFTDADGRIRSPEHALRGETIARRVLWQLEEPFAFREHVVHIDALPSLLYPRNRARAAHAVVPDDVIERMTGIWQPPDLTEAHEMQLITAQ